MTAMLRYKSLGQKRGKKLPFPLRAYAIRQGQGQWPHADNDQRHQEDHRTEQTCNDRMFSRAMQFIDGFQTRQLREVRTRYQKGRIRPPMGIEQGVGLFFTAQLRHGPKHRSCLLATNDPLIVDPGSFNSLFNRTQSVAENSPIDFLHA